MNMLQNQCTRLMQQLYAKAFELLAFFNKHKTPASLLLRIQRKNEMVSNIINIITGDEHAEAIELEKDTVHSGETICEQLASIAHVKRICVTRGINSTRVIVGLQLKINTVRK